MASTTGLGFALFDTAVGRCSIVWGPRGIRSVQLPGARPTETRARVLAHFPDAVESAPPAVVQRAIDRIVTLLRGEATDLSQLELDMQGVPPFHQRVYEVARTIPSGATLSYGQVAAQLGSPGWFRRELQPAPRLTEQSPQPKGRWVS